MGLGSSKTEVALTSDELELVKSSWKIIMENPEDNGVLIFKTFLEKHNYYSKFSKFSDVPIGELPKNKVFRKHAASIIQAINNVTIHVGDELSLKNELNALGKMHGKKNVTEHQFEELKTVLLDILIREFKLPVDTINAWNKTLSIAFPYIYEGLKLDQ